MEVYIGNIPEGLNGYELRRYVTGVLDSRKKPLLSLWKRQEASELSFKIVEKHTPSGSYHYVVATVEPKAVAEELIELLNLRFIKDKPLEEREYVPRSYMNERRSINWREKVWDGIERRLGDRRLRSSSEHVLGTAVPSPA